MKMPVGNTREMPKGVKQCQEKIEGYRKKKLIFIFPSDGGMSNATKKISTMSKKNPIYNYNMCVRLSVRPTTVPRFN
jgi:hypothetical protein